MIYRIYDIRCRLIVSLAVTMATRVAEENYAENYGRWLLGGDYLAIESDYEEFIQ
jgi:hypothetical protein